MDVLVLKERVFWNRRDDASCRSQDSGMPHLSETRGSRKFSLEEILEWISRQEVKKQVVQGKEDVVFVHDDTWLLAEIEAKEKPEALLYRIEKESYYLYKFREVVDDVSIYMPTGVTVERVPQHVLGTGVLGRAFLYRNHIQILDRLLGAEYDEVLTHEVFHIMYPEKNEVSIRLMTRNYVGDKAIYH